MVAFPDSLVNNDNISVSATHAAVTPPTINSPSIASFSVLALTAAPLKLADSNFTIAFMRTAVAFQSKAAARPNAVAWVNLTMPPVSITSERRILSALKAIVPKVAAKFNIGIA